MALKKIKKFNPNLPQIQCLECKEWMSGWQGIHMHYRKKHPTSTFPTRAFKTRKPSKPSKPVVVTEEGATTTTKKKYKLRGKYKKGTANGKNSQDNSIQTEGDSYRELYLYLWIKLEGLIHDITYQHDIPEKNFTKGFMGYVSSQKIR